MSRQENDMSTDTKVAAKQTKKAATDKKRLNLELMPSAYELLQRISDDSGKSLAEVLRTGLALYGMAHDAKQKGQGIGIVEGDEVVKEILLT